MGCPLYLAMTAAEFCGTTPLPPDPAWMACHFSPYWEGLSNLPRDLSRGSMLILNDWLPVAEHRPERIVDDLRGMIDRFSISRLLLDLQRPDVAQTKRIVEHITQNISCDIGISCQYATDNCAVFLPPIPPDMPAREYLAAWSGRKVWLETDTAPLNLEITTDGCREVFSFPDTDAPEHWDDTLFCHYRIHTQNDRITFSLYRTPEDNRQLLNSIESLGVECGVGLYQEFYRRKTALRM